MTRPVPRPGIIGLGMIGGGIAVSLVRSGQVPAVFDVREDATSVLDGVPAQLSSPADVAHESDVVIISVLTAEQVEDVLTGENGLLTQARPGLILVLVSTVSLAAVRHFIALCAHHDVVLLDAGVAGGATAYNNGLTVMIGGSEEDVNRATPVLNGFAKAVIHCGPAGAGMVAKLAKNVVVYGSWAVAREAAGLAIAGGVSLERFIEVVDQGGDVGTDPFVWLRIKQTGADMPEDVLTRFEHVAQKDLDAAQELAGELAAHLPISRLIQPQIGDVYHGRLSDPLSIESGGHG
ncbi:NAD(P)-dependent oxidoreductase [Mycobacterium sp.]|uniref:NAD(P)-dependent oxidoreductase n=1 Tax=Mycobacterium sp. TaxID=1785 RepID=UPI003F9610E3